MERVCEVAAVKYITANTDKIRSIRIDSTGVGGDDSQPVKRTREIFTKLQGITVMNIFEAGFNAAVIAFLSTEQNEFTKLEENNA